MAGISSLLEKPPNKTVGSFTNGPKHVAKVAKHKGFFKAEELPADYPITAESLTRVKLLTAPTSSLGIAVTASQQSRLRHAATIENSVGPRQTPRRALKAPPRASSKLLNKQPEKSLANRAILTISEDHTVCYVDDEQDAMISIQFQLMNGSRNTSSTVTPRDAQHLSSAIQLMKAEFEIKLDDTTQSRRMILLLKSELDDELNDMVYTISGATFQQRVNRFFEDGFSLDEIQKVQTVMHRVSESGVKSRDAASGTGSPKTKLENGSGNNNNNNSNSMPSFDDAFDFSRLTMKLEALAMQSDNGYVEPTCAAENTTEEPKSFEQFYRDEHGNDALAAGHFDVTVVEKELKANVGERIRIDDSYRPRTSSRVVEPQLMTDDSYRPRTSSRAVEPDMDTS
eukprot:m.61030 g.61030  ORF g.61030 m.61030 type:complete len:398 (-) comp22921_c0_seq1:193-1386(-)